jgi:long-chain acyl-CoA synthetase
MCLVDVVLMMIRSAVKKYPTMPFLGTRTATKGVVGAYQFQTYQQVAARITAVGSGLASLNFAAGDRVGLYSVNRADWIIAEQACFTQNLCTVPLYDTLGTTRGVGLGLKLA